MTQKYQVKVSMKQAAIVETGIVLKQGDFGMQLEIEVLDFDATGTTPQIVFRKAMGAVESTTITVSSNKYTYTFKGTELDTPGKVFCDLKLKNSTTQRISTASFMFKVVADTMDGLNEQASSYSDTIAQIVGGFNDEITELHDIATEITALSGAIVTLTVPGSGAKTSNIVLSEGLTYYITDITPNATSGTMSAYVEGHTETSIPVGPGVPGVLTAPATGYLRLWNGGTTRTITIKVEGENSQIFQKEIEEIAGANAKISLISGTDHSSNRDIIPFSLKKDERFKITITTNPANVNFSVAIFQKDSEYQLEGMNTNTTQYFVAKGDSTGIGFYRANVPSNVVLSFEILKESNTNEKVSEIYNAVCDEQIKNITFVQGTIYNGNIVSSNTECIANETYYECLGIKNIDFIQKNSIYKTRICYYRKNKQFISQTNYVYDSVFSIPNEAYYFRFAISTGSDPFTPSDYDNSIIINRIIDSSELREYMEEVDEATNTRIDVLDLYVKNAFLPDEFIQGSLYNGALNPANTECITSKEYIPINQDHLHVIYDINLNTRLTFYDSNANFLYQVGYNAINTFENYVPTNNNARYYRVSLSLSNVGSSTTTPADLANHKIYIGKTTALPEQNKVDILSIKDTLNLSNRPANPYKYFGAKINVSDNEFDFKSYMNLSTSEFADGESIQGSAVYGDYIFTAVNKLGSIAIHNISTKLYIGKITLTPVDTYHCNTISFSNVKYDPDDDFPLLYLSMENAAERKAIVMRITYSNSTWNATIVQTINFPDTTDMPIYYPNCVVDAKNNLLYIGGYTTDSYYASAANKIKMYKFALPDISSATVTLAAADIISSFEYDSMSCTQGMVIKNNKLYQCYGADWTPDKEIYICAIDLSNQAVETKILMNDYGYTSEPEALVIYDGHIYMIGVSGAVYKFEFYEF